MYIELHCPFCGSKKHITGKKGLITKLVSGPFYLFIYGESSLVAFVEKEQFVDAWIVIMNFLFINRYDNRYHFFLANYSGYDTDINLSVLHR